MVRRERLGTALSVLGAMVVMTACDKVQLTAPTQSKITLFTNATFLPVGGTAEITASVTEQAGTPVQNGTVVTFTTTVGSVDPREARTANGKATVRLTAGNVSGKAQVKAFSGDAQSDALEISVGGAAVETILLRVSPGRVPATGGTVELIATVIDATGNRLSGVPVTFAADAGQFLSSQVVSDGNGEARTSLTTNRVTNVTAAAGAKTATVAIQVGALPTVGLSVTPAAPTVGSAVTFAITLTAGDSPIQRVNISFGDGTSQSVPASGATSIAHIYGSANLYTVTVTATDSSGQSNTATAVIAVAERPALIVTLTASTSTPAPLAPVTFTANVTEGTAAVSVVSYAWDFGDDTTRTTPNNATTHIYDRVGQRNVSVTVTTADGRTATAVTEIIVR
ncbi:MAG: PKD domain-containing protein [Vicinamibacterales bacterium]